MRGRGLPVAERREDDVGRLQVVAPAEAQLGAVAELGVDGGDRPSPQPLRGDLGDLDVGMAGEQPEQLAPGVPGAALDDRPHRLSSPRAASRTSDRALQLLDVDRLLGGVVEMRVAGAVRDGGAAPAGDQQVHVGGPRLHLLVGGPTPVADGAGQGPGHPAVAGGVDRVDGELDQQLGLAPLPVQPVEQRRRAEVRGEPELEPRHRRLAQPGADHLQPGDAQVGAVERAASRAPLVEVALEPGEQSHQPVGHRGLRARPGAGGRPPGAARPGRSPGTRRSPPPSRSAPARSGRRGRGGSRPGGRRGSRPPRRRSRSP